MIGSFFVQNIKRITDFKNWDKNIKLITDFENWDAYQVFFLEGGSLWD